MNVVLRSVFGFCSSAVGVVDFPSEAEASTAKDFFTGFNPRNDGGEGMQLSEHPPPSLQQRQPGADPRAAKQQRTDPPAEPSQPEQQQNSGGSLLDALSQSLSGVDPNTLTQSFSVLQSMMQQQQQQQPTAQPAQPQAANTQQVQQVPSEPQQQQAPLPQPPAQQQQQHPLQLQGQQAQPVQPPQPVAQQPAGVSQNQLGGHLTFSMPPGSGPNAPGLQLPPDAIQTLFVEGVPKDCSTREVNHVFRPFHGFQSARLVLHQSKQKPGESTMLCFAEFENAQLATICMYCLQGYVFDRDDPDSNKLRLSYAKQKSGGPSQAGRGSGRGGRSSGSAANAVGDEQQSYGRGRGGSSAKQR